jgi:hypothetical protein
MLDYILHCTPNTRSAFIRPAIIEALVLNHEQVILGFNQIPSAGS